MSEEASDLPFYTKNHQEGIMMNFFFFRIQLHNWHKPATPYLVRLIHLSQDLQRVHPHPPNLNPLNPHPQNPPHLKYLRFHHWRA